jgi:HEAT repeat protein
LQQRRLRVYYPPDDDRLCRSTSVNTTATIPASRQASSAWQRLARRLQGWQEKVLRGLRYNRFQWQPEARAWLRQQRMALASPSPHQRWRAAAALRGVPLSGHDLTALGDLLLDAEPFVRWEAAMTLKDMGGQAAIGILQQTLAGDSPVGLAAAAESLAELGEVTAIPRLVELTQHDDPGVRASACAALGRLAQAQDEEVVQALMTALKDAIPGVRQVAAQALGRVGSPLAVAPLIAALRRRDEFRLVRRAATWSLGKLGPDPLAVEALSEALTDKDGEVRQLAAEGLGQIGHAKVISLLRPLAEDWHDTGRGTVAMAVIKAIQEIEARHAELQPPTPEVPIEHGEASLMERKQRLGLAPVAPAAAAESGGVETPAPAALPTPQTDDEAAEPAIVTTQPVFVSPPAAAAAPKRSSTRKAAPKRETAPRKRKAPAAEPSTPAEGLELNDEA